MSADFTSHSQPRALDTSASYVAAFTIGTYPILCLPLFRCPDGATALSGFSLSPDHRNLPLRARCHGSANEWRAHAPGLRRSGCYPSGCCCCSGSTGPRSRVQTGRRLQCRQLQPTQSPPSGRGGESSDARHVMGSSFRPQPVSAYSKAARSLCCAHLGIAKSSPRSRTSELPGSNRLRELVRIRVTATLLALMTQAEPDRRCRRAGRLSWRVRREEPRALARKHAPAPTPATCTTYMARPATCTTYMPGTARST